MSKKRHKDLVDTVDNTISLSISKTQDNVYNMFSNEQKDMFASIQDNIFTCCEANAGTGKTLVAVASMINLLANKEVDRVIYIQKVSQRFLQNGFLPGTMEEKTDALWLPFYDAMLTLGYWEGTVNSLIENDIITLTTDSNLRGVNFEKCGVILEESENLNEETIRLILTRCHDNCHIVMIGDSKQKDNKGRNDDFVAYGKYLASKHFGNEVHLTKNFRGRFSQAAEEFNI